MSGLCVAVLAFAFLAGPIDAACSSCCPSLPQTTRVGAAGCCGVPCGVTLERPDADRAAASVERTCFDLAVAVAAFTQPPADLRAGSLAPSAFDLSPPVFSSLSSPLRL